MARSPFLKFANATLTFDVVSSNKFTVDSVTGNDIAKMSKLTVTACLEPSKTKMDNRIREQIGLDKAVEMLAGYLVSPLQLPESLKPGAIAEAVIKTSTKTKAKGRAYLLPPLTNDPYVVGAGIDIINQITIAFWVTE
jgi:hypothetical protein